MARVTNDESVQIRSEDGASLAAIDGAGEQIYFCQTLAVGVRDLHSSCWCRRQRVYSSALGSALNIFC